jgi:hypothetical protein
MHYLEIANSPGMWVASSIVVVVIIVQAFVFMRKAYKTGLEMGISREAMQKAMRAGFISSIGPSLAVGLTLISIQFWPLMPVVNCFFLRKSLSKMGVLHTA